MVAAERYLKKAVNNFIAVIRRLLPVCPRAKRLANKQHESVDSPTGVQRGFCRVVAPLSVFAGCRHATTSPLSVFAGCRHATTAPLSVFAGCRHATTAPLSVFAGCRHAATAPLSVFAGCRI